MTLYEHETESGTKYWNVNPPKKEKERVKTAGEHYVSTNGGSSGSSTATSSSSGTTTTNPNTTVYNGTVTIIDRSGNVIATRTYSGGKVSGSSGLKDSDIAKLDSPYQYQQLVETIKRAGYSESETIRRLNQADYFYYSNPNVNPYKAGTFENEYYIATKGQEPSKDIMAVVNEYGIKTIEQYNSKIGELQGQEQLATKWGEMPSQKETITEEEMANLELTKQQQQMLKAGWVGVSKSTDRLAIKPITKYILEYTPKGIAEMERINKEALIEIGEQAPIEMKLTNVITVGSIRGYSLGLAEWEKEGFDSTGEGENVSLREAIDRGQSQAIAERMLSVENAYTGTGFEQDITVPFVNWNLGKINVEAGKGALLLESIKQATFDTVVGQTLLNIAILKGTGLAIKGVGVGLSALPTLARVTGVAKYLPAIKISTGTARAISLGVGASLIGGYATLEGMEIKSAITESKTPEEKYQRLIQAGIRIAVFTPEIYSGAKALWKEAVAPKTNIYKAVKLGKPIEVTDKAIVRKIGGEKIRYNPQTDVTIKDVVTYSKRGWATSQVAFEIRGTTKAGKLILIKGIATPKEIFGNRYIGMKGLKTAITERFFEKAYYKPKVELKYGKLGEYQKGLISGKVMKREGIWFGESIQQTIPKHLLTGTKSLRAKGMVFGKGKGTITITPPKKVYGKLRPAYESDISLQGSTIRAGKVTPRGAYGVKTYTFKTQDIGVYGKIKYKPKGFEKVKGLSRGKAIGIYNVKLSVGNKKTLLYYGQSVSKTKQIAKVVTPKGEYTLHISKGTGKVIGLKQTRTTTSTAYSGGFTKTFKPSFETGELNIKIPKPKAKSNLWDIYKPKPTQPITTQPTTTQPITIKPTGKGQAQITRNVVKEIPKAEEITYDKRLYDAWGTEPSLFKLAVQRTPTEVATIVPKGSAFIKRIALAKIKLHYGALLPISATLSSTMSRELLKVKSKIKTRTRTELETKTLTETKPDIITETKLDIITETKARIITDILPISRTITEPIIKEEEIIEPIVTPPIRPPFPKPIEIKPKPPEEEVEVLPMGALIEFGGIGKEKRMKAKSYQAFVKEKGRFRRMGKPTTQSEALDLSSKYVDETPSARFRIQQTNKKPQKNPGVNTGYFTRNQSKFRSYSKFLGMKVPMTQEYIEKERYRMDKPGEKKGIQAKGVMSLKIKKIKRLFGRK